MTSTPYKFRGWWIEGDNLEICLALKHQCFFPQSISQSISQSTTQSPIQLVFFDPPYNSTRDVIVNDDPDPHKQFWNSGAPREAWLNMISLRALAAWQILKPRGYFIATIDDKEYAYLRVQLDKQFGEGNYRGTIIWQSYHEKKPNVAFNNQHTYILVYQKSTLDVQSHQLRATKPIAESIWGDLPDTIDAQEEIEFSKDINNQLFSNTIGKPDHRKRILSHLNAKPQSLLTRILNLAEIRTGDLVLDLFAGTGSLAIAVKDWVIKQEQDHQIEQDLENSKSFPFRLDYIGMQIPFPLSLVLKTRDFQNAPFTNISISALGYDRVEKSCITKPCQKTQLVKMRF